MKCPKCKNNMKEIKVRIQDAESPVTSYQCGKCGYFDFEKTSINATLEELRLKEQPLKIKQKIINLSQGRLGFYFNKNVVESLRLKAGEEIQLSVPDKNHILLKIKN